jgi:hypothetical protein
MSYDNQDATEHLAKHLMKGVSDPNCEACATREELEKYKPGRRSSRN